uniref:Uncharacterized protein n=1 Tax=Glossina pallidipes TaxID=7398 RepID=A0A1A9ZLI0_GLOPL
MNYKETFGVVVVAVNTKIDASFIIPKVIFYYAKPRQICYNVFVLSGMHSIIQLAMCDANCTFTAIDIGAYGFQNDGSIMRRSEFGRRLVQTRLELRQTKVIRGTNIEFSYYLTGRTLGRTLGFY